MEEFFNFPKIVSFPPNTRHPSGEIIELFLSQLSRFYFDWELLDVFLCFLDISMYLWWFLFLPRRATENCGKTYWENVRAGKLSQVDWGGRAHTLIVDTWWGRIAAVMMRQMMMMVANIRVIGRAGSVRACTAQRGSGRRRGRSGSGSCSVHVPMMKLADIERIGEHIRRYVNAVDVRGARIVNAVAGAPNQWRVDQRQIIFEDFLMQLLVHAHYSHYNVIVSISFIDRFLRAFYTFTQTPFFLFTECALLILTVIYSNYSFSL